MASNATTDHACLHQPVRRQSDGLGSFCESGPAEVVANRGRLGQRSFKQPRGHQPTLPKVLRALVPEQGARLHRRFTSGRNSCDGKTGAAKPPPGDQLVVSNSPRSSGEVVFRVL